MSENPWHVDPWEAARKYHERKMFEFMAALMKKLGVAQVELDYSELLDGKDVVEITDLPHGAKHIRIRGRLSLVSARREP